MNPLSVYREDVFVDDLLLNERNLESRRLFVTRVVEQEWCVWDCFTRLALLGRVNNELLRDAEGLSQSRFAASVRTIDGGYPVQSGRSGDACGEAP